ncbi:MAG: ectonucleotide pyrophosphatase/phosphodiesterase [Rhodothermia bacterium]|nr:ectonucleotide pyrophosphatase/phosphodiesterase [Rhodothermia bacterium]
MKSRIYLRGNGIALCVVMVLLVVGCASPQSALQPRAVEEPQPLILISIDGFRHDYLDLHDAPNITALANSGVRSEGLIPVFPTLTFPNHYTIVTGLYPAQHGIVSNRFYDPELNRSFRYSNLEDAADSTWWGGEPIWITVRKQGLNSAVYFWPGSETVIDGLRPNFWYNYDGGVPGEERVDQALRWLELPSSERPSFIALYFSLVDETSHRHGPESAETAAAVAQVDGYIGRLVAGLTSRGLFDRTNILIVSDHGQADRDPEKVVYLEDYLDMSKLRFTERGPAAAFWADSSTVSDAYRKLNGIHPSMTVYTRDRMPARWRYEGSSRIPPIIAILDEGWTFGRRTDDNPRWHTGGDHGYDPMAESMKAVFVARGPAFKEGISIPEIESIHVYALMADILGIAPAPNQGSVSATRDARWPAQLSKNLAQ